jgi:hypothetical protein
MTDRVLRLSASVFVLTVSLLAAPSADAATAAQRPVLDLETDAGVTRLWVEVPLADGGTGRQLLRETSAAVALGASGGDPSGRAAFATWDETDGTERRRWFSVSRDAGTSWVEARELQIDLRLRDGAVEPTDGMPEVAHGYELPADGQLWLVQFRTIGLPEWRTALNDLGAEVLNYFPHNGHIVRAGAGVVAAARGLDFVERVEPYHPWYRIAADLRDWLEADPADGGPRSLRLNVLAFEWGESGKNRIAEAARSIGAEVVENWPNGHIIQLQLERSQLRAIAAHDDVLWIDLWTPYEDDMNLVRNDGGTDYVESTGGYCGTGVRGEVMDSGVQVDHPDFDGITTHGSFDESSHGTSTFGIVFGNGDRDGDGDAQGTGHMPCSGEGIFADYNFLGDRFAHTQELKQAPYFASFQTNSWGSSQVPNYTSASQEMDDIIWRLDIAITQSQSNTGNQNSRPQAWAKNIIAVGGIRHQNTLSTSDDSWTNGASIGPAEDGRIKPDVSYWYDSIYTTTTGSGYTSTFGGTSAATPEVAGILGLMVEMWADNVWQTDPEGSTIFEKQPHFSTIKALLVNNAQQYSFVGTTDDLTRTHQGFGRPSAQLALDRAANSFVINEDVVLELNDVGSYDVDVQAGETELKVTMVYPDPPGTTSAALHRINNLDLKVTSPSGTIYHGNNGLLDGTHSVAGGSPNTIDTVENVFVQNPEAGTWTVEVTAAEINQDAHLDTPDVDATFALVVTGGYGQLVQPFDGRVRLDEEAYGCNATIGIRVIDGNVGAGTTTVSVSSDTETTPETVVVTETRAGSGKYAATISTTSGSAIPGDGLLSLAQGDTITVEYVDADDGAGGVNVLRVDTATADCVDLQRTSLTLDDSVGGNGDGVLEPGEWVDLPLDLQNNGDGPATTVRAQVESLSPDVEVRLAEVPLADIPGGGGSGSTTQHLRIRMKTSLPCTEEISLRFHYLADGYAQTQDDTLPTGRQIAFVTDEFEGSTTWQHIAAESTATTGDWTHGDPDGTAQQPEDDATPDPGVECLFTAPNPGGLGTDDVDDGAVVARSGSFDLTGHPEARVSLMRWFSNRDLGEDVGDYYRLEIREGAAQPDVLLEELDTNQSAQAWTEVTFRVADYINITNDVSLRVSVADGPATGNLIEGAIDDMRFWDPTCSTWDPAPNTVETLLLTLAGSDLVLDWQRPELDPSHGEAVRYRVYRSLTVDSGFGEEQLVQDSGASLSWTDVGAGGASPSFYAYLVVSENDAGASEAPPAP